MGFRERLFDILSTEVTYNEFIRHLSKEYSIELLLSLTEFVQFQNAQKQKVKVGNIEIDKSDLVLPSSIPQSFIVSNAAWNGQDQAFLLFKKYIESGAEF